MTIKRFFYVGILAFVFLLPACHDLVKYSDIPEITDQGYRVVNNTIAGKEEIYMVTLKFSLIDGNGDVGHNEGEGVPLDDGSGGVDKFKSIFMKRHRKIDGEYVMDTLVANILDKSLKYLVPQGQNKTLIADVEVDVEIIPELILNTDTLQFEYYLQDREGNKSNVIFSADIPFTKPTDGYVKQ